MTAAGRGPWGGSFSGRVTRVPADEYRARTVPVAGRTCPYTRRFGLGPCHGELGRRGPCLVEMTHPTLGGVSRIVPLKSLKSIKATLEPMVV